MQKGVQGKGVNIFKKMAYKLFYRILDMLTDIKDTFGYWRLPFN